MRPLTLVFDLDGTLVHTAPDLMATLTEMHPGAELFCVVGEDVASKIETWERVEAVRDLSTLVVVNRPGSAPVQRLKGWLEHGPR